MRDPEARRLQAQLIGEKSVLVVRGEDGAINGFLNRCAHRGVEFCQQDTRPRRRIRLPVPPVDLRPRRPADRHAFPPRRARAGRHAGRFRAREHGLDAAPRRARAAAQYSRSLSTETAAARGLPRRRRCSPIYDRVFDGRELRVLGYSRQHIAANWKLMLENIKDPCHASLLHVFFVTFGLFRVDQPVQGAHGRHRPARRAHLRARRAGAERRHAADAFVQGRSAAAGPAAARDGARVSGRRDGDHADVLAQPDPAAAVEHARDAPDRAARPAANSTCTGLSSATQATTRR